MITRIILMGIVLCLSLNVRSQCTEALLPEATKQLGAFTYTKDFKIKLKEVKEARDKKQLTFPVMLNKGTQYRFVIEDAEEYEGRLIFEIFSDRGKQLSSYIPEVKKHYSILEYACHHSGMYFINFEFEGNKEGCGVMVYGFKKAQ